jgi:hypothetical protein
MDDDLDLDSDHKALDELDDDSERFTGTVLNAHDRDTDYAGRMRKRHVAKERDAELEDPGEWVSVFKSDGGLY